jgi:hypothetical protein
VGVQAAVNSVRSYSSGFWTWLSRQQSKVPENAREPKLYRILRCDIGSSSPPKLEFQPPPKPRSRAGWRRSWGFFPSCRSRFRNSGKRELELVAIFILLLGVNAAHRTQPTRWGGERRSWLGDNLRRKAKSSNWPTDRSPTRRFFSLYISESRTPDTPGTVWG